MKLSVSTDKDKVDALVKSMQGVTVTTDQATEALGDFGAEAVSLRKELREIVEQLTAMERAGKANTKEFQELYNRAGEVKDQIGDMNTRIKNLGSDTRGIDTVVEGVQAMSGAFAVGQAGLALFGEEDEALEKSLMKLQAAIALTTGVQAIANSLQKESSLVIGLNTAATKVATVAQTAYTTVVGATTGALKALRIALAATGIGAIVVLLGTLVAAIASAKEETEDYEATQNSLNDALERYNRLVKDNLSLIEQETKVAALRARIAGESQEQIQRIEAEGRKRSLAALREDYENREKLAQDFANKVTVALSKLDAADEEQAAKREELIAKEKQAFAESEKARDAYYAARAADVLAALEIEADTAEKGREAAADALKKRQEDADRAAKERLEKFRESQQRILDEIRAFNLLAIQTDADQFQKQLEREREKEELLRNLLGETDEARIQREREAALAVLDAAGATQQEYLEAQLAFDRQLEELTAERERKRTEDEKANAEAREEIAKRERDAKLGAIDAVSSALENASTLLGKTTVAGKFLAASAATISTFSSAQKAYEATVGIPVVGPVLAPINAGLAVAAGVKNVSEILKVKVPGGGSGGGAGVPAAGNQGQGAQTGGAPSFNLVEGTGTNQIAQRLANGQERPLRAYVVSGEVSTAQELDRTAVEGAGL